jgi:hypothetical protein
MQQLSAKLVDCDAMESFSPNEKPRPHRKHEASLIANEAFALLRN